MDKNIKNVVKEKYGQIARQSKAQNQSSCCGVGGCCSTVDYSVFNDDYKQMEGYNPDADLGLGCGLPTEFAGIKAGDAVLDLGSGAGNDCFVARSIVGDTGHVTGLDFTKEMLKLARANNLKMGYSNVEFVQGDIEEMPLPDSTYDVVVSNCVLNLVPDKEKAFRQIHRVLKPEGHFCVSDVVIQGELPEKLHADAEMYVGCVSGAIAIDDYLGIIKKTGFDGITVHKKKAIELPREILLNYLSADDIDAMGTTGTGIFSITVSAFKTK
ncbi:MAG: arsenite S-adenosylmethyltransferase [Bacteroidetes bacterium HGW-Bacteroidetes-22]|nr:MAG: arsenite S-adenosylmethyltransferase [Bacteroidetes bacterium HGW-Bacteroidetes-22]